MKTIDFYAGAGGASLGLRVAGFEVVAHLERDAAALRTLRANGWDGVIGCDIDDVARVSPPSLLRPRSPVLPAADAWWLSCPCQPFSSAGDRAGAEDERDGYPATLALLERHRPRWAILENVRGLLTHSREFHPDPKRCPGCYFETILARLRTLFAVVEYRVLCAADYGVPQTRHRVIVVCGPVAIDWPAATHTSATLDEVKADGRYWSACEAQDWTRDLGGGADGLRPWETMRRALRLPLPGVVVGGGTRPHFAGDERRHRDLSEEPSPTVPASSDGSGGPWVETALDRPSTAGALSASGRRALGVVRTGNRTTGPNGTRPLHEVGVDNPAPTIRSQEGTGPELVSGDPDHHAPWWHRASPPDGPARAVGTRRNAAILTDDDRAVLRLTGETWERNPVDLPAPAVTATEVKGAAMSADGVRTSQGGYQRPSDALQHGTGRRRLTEREVAILQDFPEDYVFCGATSEDVYRQIGNAVPPRMAEVIARAVLAADATFSA